MSSLLDQYNILKNFVLNNDATSLQSALEDSDQTHVLIYCPDDQDTLLGGAAGNNFVCIAKLLLHARADVNQPDSWEMSPLISAAMCGHDEMVRLLLEQPNVEIDAEGMLHRTALMCATAHGRTSIVQQLLEARADVGCSLVSAADGGYCHLLELLLQHKADIHARERVNGHGCLHAAARQGSRDAVSLLLQANAPVDMVNHIGTTPLMTACFRGHISIVRLLLAAGANVHHRNNDLRTALHEACCGGKQPVDELLQAGADPNAVDCNGEAGLHMAAGRCWMQVGTMMSLLHAKADIDLADHNDNTPLISAVAGGFAQSAHCLLQNGADVLKKGRKSARQWARQGAQWYRRHDVAALFKCALCGWQGMCCFDCRKKYCVIECDKCSDEENFFENNVDCKLHRKIAHQSIVEWTLAMSTLNLPPYVLETIFNSLKLNSTHKDYQQRKAMDFISIENNEKSSNINTNFVHLIIEERTHQQNIKLFISIQKAFQKTIKRE